MTLDLHVDTPWIWTKRGDSVVTPEYMKKGGLDGVVYVLYLSDSLQHDIGTQEATKAINSQIQFVKGRIKADGAGKSFMALEGGRLLNQNLSRLEELAREGIKYLTLVHNNNTYWADSATDMPFNNGLQEFGYKVIRACNKLGVLVDISHSSDKTAFAALNASTHPVIASHSGCRKLINHPRNLTDELIKAVAATGGIIGVPFAKKFCGDVWSSVSEHIDHIAQLVGPDHVAVGSDLDGATMTVGGETAANWKTVVEYGLTVRGYTDDEVDAISGGNARRLFNELKAET